MTYTGAPQPWDSSDDHGDQLQPSDTLLDRGVDDMLDEGVSPAERPCARDALTLPETLDQMLSEEEPDPATRLNVVLDEDEQRRADDAERDAEFPERREVGRARAGRLVAPDRGFGADTEAELVAEDVGICGGAASAEEAAVHVIEADVGDD